VLDEVRLLELLFDGLGFDVFPADQDDGTLGPAGDD
jgi:hypothetical protein